MRFLGLTAEEGDLGFRRDEDPRRLLCVRVLSTVRRSWLSDDWPEKGLAPSPSPPEPWSRRRRSEERGSGVLGHGET